MGALARSEFKNCAVWGLNVLVAAAFGKTARTAEESGRVLELPTRALEEYW